MIHERFNAWRATILAVLFAGQAAGAQRPVCAVSLSPSPTKESVQERIQAALKADQGKIERRVKVLTRGQDDTADPAIPVKMNLPDGRTVWAIYYSGGRVVYYDSMNDILRGGVRDFDTIEVYASNGRRLRMNPYHKMEAIWDGEPVFVEQKNSDGSITTLMIGHGGMMERMNPNKPSEVGKHNYRRSRHAFSIELRTDEKSGKIRQIWRDLGPIHGNQPTPDGRWMVSDGDRWHAHGYGSRLIRGADGQPYRDSQGSMWITYEQVTQEKRLPDGRLLPYATEMFARRMNHNLTQAVGEPVRLSSYTPHSEPNRPYRASMRKGPDGNEAGYLVEGPNPILMKIGDKEYWVVLFSAGDFVAEYGNYMMYREKSEGPIGEYKHVTDKNGELVNITAKMERDFDMTWSGRLNAFYSPDGKLWGLAHGIFKSDIPDGWVKTGWPRTSEEFVQYARRGLLVPLEATIEDGRPIIRVSNK